MFTEEAERRVDEMRMRIERNVIKTDCDAAPDTTSPTNSPAWKSPFFLNEEVDLGKEVDGVVGEEGKGWE